MCFNTSVMIDDQEKEVQECQMFAKTTVEPKNVKIYELQLNKDGGEPSIVPRKLLTGDQIAFEEMALIFEGASVDESTLSFKLFNSSDEYTAHTFSYGLKYWPSHCNYTRYQNSGAYDFRPMDNLFSPLPYSKLIDAVFYYGNNTSKMIFTFGKLNRRSQ